MCKFTTIILLCVTFSIITVKVSGQNVDINILKGINSESPVGLRKYSEFITNTTTIVSFSTPVVLGIAALIENDDQKLKNAIYVAASIGVDGVLTYSLKRLIARPRPFVDYPNEIIPYTNEESFSMPSGHTSLAFATATALSLKYPKWYVIVPGSIWACSVGYSRLNLGVHYPSDVLAGAVLGAGSAFVTYKVNEWFWNKREHKKLIGLNAYL